MKNHLVIIFSDSQTIIYDPQVENHWFRSWTEWTIFKLSYCWNNITTSGLQTAQFYFVVTTVLIIHLVFYRVFSLIFEI